MKTMTPRLLLAGLIATFAMAAPVAAQDAPAQGAPASNLQPLDRIAAVVNEDVILRSELDRAVKNVTAQYASQPGQLPPQNVLERQVLERLILMKLQVGYPEKTDEVAILRRQRQSQANHLLLRLRKSARSLSFRNQRKRASGLLSTLSATTSL